jgi:hypothetical protein
LFSKSLRARVRRSKDNPRLEQYVSAFAFGFNDREALMKYLAKMAKKCG